MRRFVLPLAVLGCSSMGCFSPEAPGATSETDDASGSGETTAGATMGQETTTDGPTTVADTEPSNTTGPTSGPSTTDPTVGDTEGETTFGGNCIDSSECDTGVCIDMECVPCGDAPDPDTACSEADASTPVCAGDGTCVACLPDSCGGGTPACDPAVGCVACNEHSQCPDSACHLGGPDQGSCFDTADVVEVSDTEEFEQAFVQGNPGGQVVIRLQPGSFQIAGSLTSNVAEVAIIGSDSTITGGATSLFFNIPDLFYLSNLSLEDGPSRAISCNAGEQLWLDDTSISNYPIALLSSCDVHVRRSQFRGDPGGTNLGATLSLGGSFTAVNSDFGPAGDPMFEVSGAELDIRYSTIAGNQMALECGSTSSGVIRNSIITSVGDSVYSTCGLSYIDNAIDQESFGGTVVPSYNPDWFVVSNGSRFFLSASGQEVFEGIADWDEGDPRFDIEGDPRPTETPGYPGVDEP